MGKTVELGNTEIRDMLNLEQRENIETWLKNHFAENMVFSADKKHLQTGMEYTGKLVSSVLFVGIGAVGMSAMHELKTKLKKELDPGDYEQGIRFLALDGTAGTGYAAEEAPVWTEQFKTGELFRFKGTCNAETTEDDAADSPENKICETLGENQTHTEGMETLPRQYGRVLMSKNARMLKAKAEYIVIE